MRIVAGEFGSRMLAAPRRGTRPTSDRAREALFASLGDLGGAVVLDLFAGSGALGLEALSRGAASCLFCEIDADAVRTLADNVERLGVGSRTRIVRRDARRLLRDEGRRGARYDLVLVDPPYRSLQDFLPALDAHLSRLAAPGARIVVEAPHGLEVRLAGFEEASRRRVGAAGLHVLTATRGPDR